MEPLLTSILTGVLILLLHFASTERELHIGLLVPRSGLKSMGEEVVDAARLGIQAINSDTSLTNLRGQGYNFSFMVSDTACDTGQGLQRVVEMATGVNHSGTKVDAFIGPSCDNVCETAGLLAGRWSIPMVSYGCEETKLSNQSLYPTFARTTSSFDKMTGFLKDVLNHYGWNRVMLVTTSAQVWLETEAELLHHLNANKFHALQWNIHPSDWLADMTDILVDKGQQSKVFVLLMFGLDVLRFMKAAKNADLLEGKHVFITIDFANMGKRIGDPSDGPHLTGLLDITMDVTPESETFIKFVDAIDVNSTLSTYSYVNNDNCSHYEFGIHAGLVYDAIMLYARAVDSSLKAGYSAPNGYQIAKYMYNVTIQGVTGNVSVMEDGTRQSQFMLHNLRSGCYFPVARSADEGRAFIYLNQTVVWPGGTEVIPLGRPACGWDGKLCGNEFILTVASTGTVSAIVFLVILGGFLYWRHEQNKRDSSRAWIIHSGDLRLKDKGLGKSRLSIRNVSPSGRSVFSDSRVSLNTESSYGQVFAEQYIFHNEEVAGKRILVNSKAGIAVTKQLSKNVNHVIQLSNANICKFYGVCVDAGQEMTIWEYCRKGSVQDVIHNDKKYLEDMPFKISFMNDITKGLRYLHHSRLGHHGRLKSANVLVDNRWTCKLTHMIIPGLSKVETVDDENVNYEKFLSTPPENLRTPSLSMPGSKAADMYSFGIVLLEIFTEIISRLKQGGTFPFRPYIPEYIDHKTKNVIMECWREQPEERPSIDHVASLIRHISLQYSGKDKSLMEQMLDKVTREADLQAQELEEEKNKSDQLLYQMLPPIVADCLKKQIEVKPETFQSATVYFSDIQGFTELSSVSEPIEIVNFLNDVYYKFDNIIEKYKVYKVETIGDAYVVCSGVPLMVDNHASEIAKMALHIMSCSSDLKVLHRPEQKFHMRIGMHSGPVAAGVVGRTMPRYCLFGDTVNTASRMESTSLAGRIQISQQCKDLLDNDVGFNYEAREPIHVKGKGLLQTYFLLSKDGFHPVESSLFEELHSTYSLQDKSKPYTNGGSKSMTNPPNSEIVVNTHCHVESPKVLDCGGSMNDSKMSVNNVLTEVSVA
ncbi:hypothetical protein BsWGS_13930 [Bradybaena similaris]